MSNQVLHFTLGPVQTFVSQARRTRDLWAGSFLLSWLSGVAMHSIVAGKHGSISFPDVNNDPLFGVLLREDGTPRIGSLPNRFRADIDRATFDVKAVCAEAIDKRWTSLAELVWDTFVRNAASAEIGIGTREIWDQQINNFWDIAWIMGPSDDPKVDGKWLDQRKNWRSYLPPEQPGDHCTLMHDWQELSGLIRSYQREEQDKFWLTLRRSVAKERYGWEKLGTLELGESERLCAPALVKRLFPVLFCVKDPAVRNRAAEIIGFVPCGHNIPPEGRADAVVKWRSTAHLAATP